MHTPDVTSAEFAVLERLWLTPASTIRQLADHLYPGGSTSHYATVQKLLERLEAKGCVSREAIRAPHTFSPTVSREDLFEGRLKALADKFTGGSLTPLLTHLLEAHRLSAKDLQHLRSLIDARSTSSSKRGK